jgi:uncharacterized membrane protein YedE/YeeE
MEHFTPFASLFGGVLMGVSSSLLFVLSGRIAGISGIVSGTVRATQGDRAWRALFVAGLVLGGAVMAWLRPGTMQGTPRGLIATVVAGVLVGFGSQLGGGCTSGHGICGMGRMSKRSFFATMTFMGTAAITVFVAQHMLGGAR